MERAGAQTADGVGPGLRRQAGEMAAIADEARQLGQRLARLCALARATGCPDPGGLSVDDLAGVADALRGWADHLAGDGAGSGPSGGWRAGTKELP